MRRNAEQKGMCPAGLTPTKPTTKNYLTYLATNSEVALSRSVRQQTRSRFAAENSLRSATSFLMTVAACHLIVGEVSTLNTRIEKATPGAQKLMRLVQGVHQNPPMFHVHPALLLSTDDSTMFVFEGKSKSEYSWHLHSNVKHSAQSVYSAQKGGTDHLHGLRVRLTHTMCGLGIMAPLYVTIYGLSERELPHQDYPSGVLVLEIPGLCYASNLDARSSEKGYVVFTRASINLEEEETVSYRNFKNYRQTVLLPYIQTIRSNYFQWIPGTPVPDDLTCVSWVDGGMSQLQSIIGEQQQQVEVQLKIYSCKQSSSRTAVEQACDVSPFFRSLHKIQKKTLQ